MKNRLWFDKWTEEYMEGLPTGNGRLAAMMLGRPEKLQIALNHEWMWRGENRNRDFPDMSQHLQEVRNALLSDDFLAGTELANRYFGGKGGVSGEPNRVDPYQPVGDLWIELDAGTVSEYKRELSLDTGLAVTEFNSNICGKVEQAQFVSCADDCIVVHIQAENPCEITIALTRREDPHCRIAYETETNSICMRGSFDRGICFEAEMRVATDGGCRIDENRLILTGAQHATILIQVGTSAKNADPRDEMIYPTGFGYDTLLCRHSEQFRQLKGDAHLEIDIADCDLPTNQRIQQFKAGKDPSLPLLYFEYGRYLMISGSSGELPINLQGKWNDELQPPWESDYHLDINLQMCYWFVETLGMQHAANTLFNLIERYAPHGRKMARNLYGCNGLTLCLQTDVWGRMTPESYGWSVWTGAAPWLAQHMFMHWRYTKDLEFLRSRCYPFLKEAAVFYEDYLIERNGQLWIVPSQSPENRFEGTGDWPVSLGYNSAMDIELITELLTNAAECADVLDTDADKAEKWRDIVARLPRLSVDSKGRLNEWDSERVEVEPGHRHLSHLYGLFPAQLFEPGSWEWTAAERSLDARLSHGGGHTGWSRSWVACMMARLGRSEDAWNHFIALIGDFATVSLLDLHPPRIFQIDGNMGGTVAVCEMLMQSRRGRLQLLPALPKAWPKGKARNFRAQDGVSVCFEWKNGQLSRFELTASEDQTLTVSSGERQWTLHLKANTPTEIQL